MRIRPAVVASLPAATLLFALACGGRKPPVTPEPPVTETVPDAGEAAVPDAATKKTLFERLGGKDGIGQVVDAFVKNIQADNRVSKPFAKTKGERMQRFHDMLVDQLCEVTQGPCTYQGRDMKNAHKSMKVTNKQFDAMVEDLQAAMAELKVPDAEQAELVQLLAPMREDIVMEKRRP